MAQDKQQARHLTWDACYNVRDVGGYATEDGGQTRWRTLIRADNLHRLTPEGQAALCNYGVFTIIDLRLAPEVEQEPNPFAVQQEAASSDHRPRYLNLPLHDIELDILIDKAAAAQGEYILILEESKRHIGAVIRAVATALEEGSVLVHCHGGKDRTGIVVALLLSIAGVPRETVIRDYAMSETLLEAPHTAWLEEQSRIIGRPKERPLWMLSPPGKMDSLLSYLDGKYGSIEGYLKVCGVTRSQMAQIRQHLVAAWTSK